MKRNETIKRDNALVEYILQHKGSQNAIPTETICKALAEQGYTIKASSLHTILTKIINERHLPICSLNGKGYYWAKTKQDVIDCIAHLQSRIDALQNHIEHLKNFIIE